MKKNKGLEIEVQNLDQKLKKLKITDNQDTKDVTKLQQSINSKEEIIKDLYSVKKENMELTKKLKEIGEELKDQEFRNVEKSSQYIFDLEKKIETLEAQAKEQDQFAKKIVSMLKSHLI